MSAQQLTTWWPDPESGLMWTGSVIGDLKNGMNYQQAHDKCADVTIGTYTGWRLPTLTEINAASRPATAYASVMVGRNGHDGGIRTVPDYSSPVESSELGFNSFSQFPLFTSSSAGPGKIYIKRWSPPGSSHAVKLTDGWRSTGNAQAFCIRTMEPDLLHLAKKAHPPTPVTGLPQLESIALLVQAEDALANDNFATAISTAKQALELDPKSLRALDDIGVAEAYAGNWSDALSNLQTAHKLDKNFPETNMDLKWVETFQKQAVTDPKAKQAWIMVHDADVAQSNESYEDAVASANQVITSEPDWPEGYDRLGLALGGLDQWQDAITALDKAVSLDKQGTTNAKQDLKNAKKIQKKEQKKG